MRYVQVAIGSIKKGPLVQSGGSEKGFPKNMVSEQAQKAELESHWQSVGKDMPRRRNKITEVSNAG